MASIREVQEQIAKQEAALEVKLYRPDGELYMALDGTPSTISVVGAESKRMRRFEEAQRERIRKGVALLDDSPEREREERIERCVAAAVGWHGWDDGQAEIEFSPQALRALLSTTDADGEWIGGHLVNQLERRITAHGLFSKASSDA